MSVSTNLLDENVQKHSSSNEQSIPNRCRTILWFMLFSGYAIDAMTRMNLSIAIVDMIVSKNISNIITETNLKQYSSQCIIEQNAYDTILPENSSTFSNNLSLNTYDDDNEHRFSIERRIFDALKINYDKVGFNWNEHEQNLILASYFWLHWLTQIPGGVLARTIGTKKVYGISLFIICILCFLTPILAFSNLWLLIILRTIQGLLGGVMWPSVHNIVAQWIPPNERSKFLTCIMGYSIGVGIFYPLFGYIIVYSSWEWVFHFVSIIGIIWFIFWQHFVYDSPSQHPYIDAKERDYIIKALDGTFSYQQDIKTPWAAIFTSIPVWMNILVQFGNMWSIMTIMVQTPTYLKQILGFNIESAGLLSGIPQLTRVIFGYLFSIVADHLLNTEKISRTNVRKLATFFTSILSGIFVISFAYAECYVVFGIFLLILSITVSGAITAGPLASIIDMSPNFSGVICGIIGTISILPGFLSPFIVGVLTYENQTVQQWQYVFLIVAGWLLSTGFLYMFFSESKIQPWNNVQNANKQNCKR